MTARQMSDWDMRQIKFSPFEELRIISCGKENIRFWRVKDAHMPGQSVVLNGLARNTVFTDICFEANKNAEKQFLTGGDGEESMGYRHRAFASTENGEVAVIDYKSKEVLVLHKLHNAPISSIRANEGFCVTASVDKYIRVCPLDFQSFYMHCMHDAEVCGVDLTADGLKVLSCCKDGSIGVLDMNTQYYEVIHRSHAAKVNDCIFSPGFDEIVTCTADGYIKVWNRVNNKQNTEFHSGTDAPVCCAAHPKRHFVAIGFQSGTVRVFDVDGPCVIHEFLNFNHPVGAL